MAEHLTGESILPWWRALARPDPVPGMLAESSRAEYGAQVRAYPRFLAAVPVIALTVLALSACQGGGGGAEATSSLACVPADLQAMIYDVNAVYSVSCDKAHIEIAAVVSGLRDASKVEDKLASHGFSQVEIDPGDGTYMNGSYQDARYVVNFAINPGGPDNAPDGWIVDYIADAR